VGEYTYFVPRKRQKVKSGLITAVDDERDSIENVFFIYGSLNMGALAPSSLTAAQAAAPGLFRSPLDEAYYYYGAQNPLDPGVGAG
jgi:hypothetical protein